jgi:hypothetical protein
MDPGSPDPYPWLTDLDSDPAPDPAIFISDLQDTNYKLFLFCSLLFEATFTLVFEIKSHKEVTKQ